MSKGAKAMVARLHVPGEGEGRARQKGFRDGRVFRRISYKMLSEARTVIALAPDLVDEVKKGQRSLADAYM